MSINSYKLREEIISKLTCSIRDINESMDYLRIIDKRKDGNIQAEMECLERIKTEIGNVINTIGE